MKDLKKLEAFILGNLVGVGNSVEAKESIKLESDERKKEILLKLTDISGKSMVFAFPADMDDFEVLQHVILKDGSEHFRHA